VSGRFEELAWQATPLGEISLRRRFDPSLAVDIFEVKLGDEFLMSSLFTVAEEELSRLGLAAVPGTSLDVLVGGLGLGYTAVAALEDERVRSVTVVDAVEPVIDWHRRGLLPVSERLTGDPRTRLDLGDFFDRMRKEPDPTMEPAGGYDAILVDIDHSPRHLLVPGSADFYTADGLRRLRRHLTDGGVFALWSDDPPDEEYGALLAEVFATSAAHVVPFANPLTGGQSANTVYVAS
jgi:spermidine synthase